MRKAIITLGLIVSCLVALTAFQNTRYNQIAPGDRQGNGAKFQMAGVNSGATGAVHCNDAAGNATTVGCSGGGSSGLWNPQISAPPSTGWSWDNQNGSTITSGSGVEYLVAPADGKDLHVRYRSAPATPYSVTALLVKDWRFTSKDCRFSLIFRESSTGKLIAWTFGKGTADPGTPFQADSKYTNSTTFSADYLLTVSNNLNWTVQYPQFAWLRMRDDGTNLSFYYSPDGVNVIQYDINRARNNWFTTGPDGIGFSAGSASSVVTGVSLLSWTIS